MKRFLQQSIADHPGLFIGTFTAVIVLKITSIAPALMLGAIIDSLGDGLGTQNVTGLLMLSGYAAVIVAQAGITPLQTYCLARLVQQTVKNSSIAWTAEILGKEFGVFSGLKIGQLIKSTDRGITAHEHILGFFVTVGLPLTIEITVVSSLFLYFGGLKLFLALLFASVIYLLVCHYIIQWRTPHINDVNQSEDEVSELLYGVLRAGYSLKIEGNYHHALTPLNSAFGRYAQSATKVASSAAALGAAKNLFVGLSTCGLLAWGINSQSTSSPAISVGDLVAICSIAGGFLINISGFSEAYRSAHQFLADKARLQKILGLPRFQSDHRTADVVPEGRSCLRLSCCALADDRLVLTAPLRLDSQQSVAITGPSGAGKSTLLELLVGIESEHRHQLYLDDVCVQDLKGEAHLAALRYCPQSPVFLPGDMLTGVMYGRAIEPSLRETARDLELGALVDHLQLNDSGNNISGGQAKRLSLLRLINRPGIFNFFDEPTASLDRRLADIVWKILMKVFKRRGLVCVTHDAEALALFDRVLVVKEGRVIADGTWSELQRRDGLRDLVAENLRIRRENETGAGTEGPA